MTDDLVKRLLQKAFRTETHELLDEAADRIEKLEANIKLQLEWYLSNKRVLADRIKQLEAALREIADNSCCDTCREAALVARKALEGKDD